VTVTLIDHMGSDETVARAAWVSTQREQREASPEAVEKLIRFLLSNRPAHASPFAHPHLTVLVECPIFVSREWMRHRVWQFSEVSSRYSDMSGEAYLPPLEDFRTQVGRPGDYRMEPMDPRDAKLAQNEMRGAYHGAALAYESLLEAGVAREVARNVLPLGTMTRFYGTVSLRNALAFLTLRDHPAALLEIRRDARALREILCDLFPIVMRVWEEEGCPSL
jgi:thymidylate synthase (FAD)